MNNKGNQKHLTFEQRVDIEKTIGRNQKKLKKKDRPEGRPAVLTKKGTAEAVPFHCYRKLAKA